MIRITHLLLFTSLLILSCGQAREEQGQQVHQEDSLPQTPPKAIAANKINIQNIADIQKAHAAILKLKESKSLDSTSFRYNCNGEKGGTVSYYTDNGDLKLIIHRYHEYDHYEAEDQFFINDAETFFVYQKALSWSFDGGQEGATRDRINEQRSYFVANKPIKCLEKKYEIRKHLGINPKPESIANKEKDCNQLKSPLSTYSKLKGYWKAEPPKCLEL